MDLFVTPPVEVAVIVCGGCMDLVLLNLSFDEEESESLEEEEDDDEEDPDDDDESDDDEEEDDESLLPAAPIKD